MQKRWKTNLSSTSENAFTIHCFWVQLSKKDLKPFSIIAQCPHTLSMFLRKPATILWTRTASTEVHTCSHKENSLHSRNSFSLLDEEFCGTASLFCWGPFFILVLKLRTDKNFEISRKFLGCKYSFFGCFCRVGQVSAGRLFSLCREWETSAVGKIAATRLGCEQRLRGRKFPDDSPRQLRATHLGPPTIQRDLPQNDRLCSPTNHIIGTPRSVHQQPTYFWKQFSSDLSPGSF